MTREDYRKYSFTKGTFIDIDTFFDAKEKYLKDKNPDTLYWMQFYFLYAHCALKEERAWGKISMDTLEELTEGLKEGL